MNRNIAYGHQHLSTTLDKPVQDYEGLRRESERLDGVPGSSYGGPSADPRATAQCLSRNGQTGTGRTPGARTGSNSGAAPVSYGTRDTDTGKAGDSRLDLSDLRS